MFRHALALVLISSASFSMASAAPQRGHAGDQEPPSEKAIAQESPRPEAQGETRREARQKGQRRGKHKGQRQGQGQGQRKERAAGRIGALILRFDRDGDGKLGPRELGTARKAFLGRGRGHDRDRAHARVKKGGNLERNSEQPKRSEEKPRRARGKR